MLQREARLEAQRERDAAGRDRAWVTNVRGLPRRQKVGVRGKRVLYKGIRKLEEKAATLTRDFVRNTKEEAAKRRE